MKWASGGPFLLLIQVVVSALGLATGFGASDEWLLEMDQPRSRILVSLIVLLACCCFYTPTQSEETRSEKAAALNEEGVRLFEKGDYTAARERFKSALESDPTSKQIRINLGKTHTAVALSILDEGVRKGGGRAVYRRALEEIERGLMHWKGDAETHHAAGFCHMQLRDHEAAARSFERVLTDDPDNFRSWRLLAFARESSGQLASAEKALERAVALKPGASDLVERLKRVRHDRRALKAGHQLKTAHYRFYFPGQLDRAKVVELSKTLEEFTQGLMKRWAIGSLDPVVVLCYPPGKFAENTGLHEDIGGAFDGKIRIAFPADLAAGGLELEQVARHEAVHMLLRALAEPPPRWLDEGIAQVLDGDPREGWKPRWEELAKEQPQVSIEERELAFRPEDSKSWGALYLHAFFFVSHLRAIGKDFRLDMLVREAGRGRSWGAAFESVYGKSAEQLDRAWRHGL